MAESMTESMVGSVAVPWRLVRAATESISLSARSVVDLARFTAPLGGWLMNGLVKADGADWEVLLAPGDGEAVIFSAADASDGTVTYPMWPGIWVTNSTGGYWFAFNAGTPDGMPWEREIVVRLQNGASALSITRSDVWCRVLCGG